VMQNNSWQRTKKRRKIIGIFVALIIVAVGVYLMFVQKREDQNYDLKVTAVVTEVHIRQSDEDRNRNEYRADCEYEIDGVRYYHTTPWRDNKYTKGDKISLSVKSDDPEARNKHEYSTAGWICFCISGIVLYFTLRH